MSPWSIPTCCYHPKKQKQTKNKQEQNNRRREEQGDGEENKKKEGDQMKENKLLLHVAVVVEPNRNNWNNQVKKTLDWMKIGRCVTNEEELADEWEWLRRISEHLKNVLENKRPSSEHVC